MTPTKHTMTVLAQIANWIPDSFASWPEDVHYAVFRLNFDMLRTNGSLRLPPSPVVMDMGPVFDVASFYLNGRRVGRTGRFPEGDEPAFTEAAQRARFVIFPEDWSDDGHNELVALVYRERGVGGPAEIPGLPLLQPFAPDGGVAFQFFGEALKRRSETEQSF